MKHSNWPSQLLDVEDVRQWIASQFVDTSTVTGPTTMEQVKSWGVVARFQVRQTDDTVNEVIFKASHLPLFTYGARVDRLLMHHFPGKTPELLAAEQWEDKAWMIYRPFSALRISSDLNPEGLCRIATTFAEIQNKLSRLSKDEFTSIPRTNVSDLPRQFAAVISEIIHRQWKIWQSDETWILDEFAIPNDLVQRLQAFEPQFIKWTNELAAQAWPATIEHADLQADNAALTAQNEVLLFDWEEATVGCPFFSLSRLIDDGRDFDIAAAGSEQVLDRLYSPTEQMIRQAYVTAIQWQSLVERERAFDLAMCLAPIRTIHDGILFAAAQGWTKGIPPQVGMLSMQALRRWEAYSLSSPK